MLTIIDKEIKVYNIIVTLEWNQTKSTPLHSHI